MQPPVKAPSVIDVDTRERLLRQKRPRAALPMITEGKRRLPLLDAARAVDRQTRPVYAVWETTLRCDLACRHCGSRAGAARHDELSTEECLDLVAQLEALGVREVTLIGGEAYLRDDWLTLIRAVREHGMECTMTTGGRGFTAERARLAKEAGLQSVSVSIDGSAEVHDRLRGVPGSHKAAVEALTHLKAAGVKIAVNTQINRLSLPDLPEVLELVIALGAHSVQLQLTVAMGRAADEPEVLLQPYDLLSLFPLLDRLKTRCEEASVRLWPGNNLGYFGPYEGRLRGTMPRGHLSSCGAGRYTLGIEADGTIKGCPSLPTEQWTGGNVRDASLVDIWERGAAMRYTRDRSVADLWGYCRSCYYADECRAGCTWTSFVLFGKPGNNPYCHHRALEMQRAGKRERVVLRQPAPGTPFDHAHFDLVEEPLDGSA
jgi:radical SAM protein with 4Fe4S-binding SPASM domain